MPIDEFEDYQRASKEIRSDNTKLLVEFNQWLSQKGLAEKTIRQHAQNIEFFVNTYLLYEEAIPAKEGVAQVSSFLGYWFIRKAMWASPSSIRQNAASLKKFYAFMHERGDIDADDLQDLKDTIKEGMPEWLATLQRYDDPDLSDPMAIWDL